MSLLSKAQQITLHGNAYSIIPHPAMEGLKLMRSIGAHLKGAKLDFGDMASGSVSPEVVMDAVAAICAYSVDNDPSLSIVTEFLRHTQVTLGGKQTYVVNVFDDHFGANWNELLELLVEVFKVNRFLDAWGTTGAPVGSSAAKASSTV